VGAAIEMRSIAVFLFARLLVFSFFLFLCSGAPTSPPSTNTTTTAAATLSAASGAPPAAGKPHTPDALAVSPTHPHGSEHSLPPIAQTASSASVDEKDIAVDATASNDSFSYLTHPTWYLIIIVALVSFGPARRFLKWGMGDQLDFLWGRIVKLRKRVRKSPSAGDLLNSVEVSSPKSSASSSVELQEITKRFTPSIHREKKTSLNYILNDSAIQQISDVLPNPINTMDWILLYNSYEHGQSLSSFLRRVARAGPTVCIFKDSNRYIFGAYISQSWCKSSSYFGTGESFVMTIAPQFAVYRWSKTNSYFAYVSDENLGIGGGNNFAIWLDVHLRKGSSMSCQTFDSPCLASATEFDCFGVEVYGFT